MMDWTDKHYRYFARLISKHSVLYTEMVTTGAIIHGDIERHLAYNEDEHPLALQLGGSDIDELARCARLAEQRNYDEVNLNVGCPSDRVQNNMIGACLMGHAQLVRDALYAMQDACNIPVTIKHRIGIDEFDSEAFLFDFVDQVQQSGCRTFIVHARKAVLNGLSPKQNREVPPLIYDRVYLLKKAFPQLEIIINGGITNLIEVKHHLSLVDGVMVGREAYQNPWLLAAIDREIYGDQSQALRSRHSILRDFYPYVEQQLMAGQKLSYMSRHILGLFHGQAGGKKFRRYLSENAHLPGADIQTLDKALQLVPEQSDPVSF